MPNDTYRILTPFEFLALMKAVPKEKHEILVDTMMFTGMRYEELVGFSGHPDCRWFDAKNHAVSIPATWTKTDMDRVVHLTPAFSQRLDKYLKRHKEGLEFPARTVMNGNLKMWWQSMIETRLREDGRMDNRKWYPSVKTFRKSWESWLLQADYSIHKVAMSQGVHRSSIRASLCEPEPSVEV